MAEESGREKTVTENDAQECFVVRYFWLHVWILELTFHVIQFTEKAGLCRPRRGRRIVH